MTGMRFRPKGYGCRRRGPDEVKRDGWKEQGVLAVCLDDPRLAWPERELPHQLGNKLYGPRPSDGEQPMGDWTYAAAATHCKPWKLVCWEIGISRATANRHWQYGLAVITWRLTGRRFSARKPMNHVIRQAREV